VARYLSDLDPAGQMQAWTDGVREAVRTKTAVSDMPTEALEMAWGYPELIRKDREGDALRELWVYPGNKRIVHVLDGHVVSTELK
jgi:hypothetical protein